MQTGDRVAGTIPHPAGNVSLTASSSHSKWLVSEADAAPYVVGRTTDWSTQRKYDAVLLVCGFVGGVGVFCDFYPAREATGLNHIRVPRYE